MPIDERLERALEYADRWLAYRRWRLRIPGVQVAVRVDGELALSSAHGVADELTGEALTPQHRFRIASHSKSIAALAVARLVEQGALRFDDRVDAHVPELRDAEAGALTLADLLSHGSGLTRDGEDVAFWALEAAFPERDALVELVGGDASRLPVATELKYSNIGFGLVGLLVEAVTGASYADALGTLLVAPLGLTATTAELGGAAEGPLASGHSGLHSADARRVLGSPTSGALAAATGAVSTAAELSDLLRTVTDADDRLLEAATRRRLRQRRWSASSRSGSSLGYGLGLMLTTVDERTWVGHGGAWTGQATRTLVDPERDLVVSVLTNAIDGPAEELAVGVARILHRALQGEAPDRAEELRSFEGTFASIWGRMDVVELGGELLAITPTAPDPLAAVDVLEPLGDDRVRITAATAMGSGHEIARVERDDEGRVARWRGAWHMDAVAALPDGER